MKFSTLKWSALSGMALSLALLGGCSKEDTPAENAPAPATGTGAPAAPVDTMPSATGAPAAPAEGMPPATETKPSETPREATPAPAPDEKVKDTEPKKD